MKVKRQRNQYQRQGKSFVLLLTIGCAIILGCVAGYFHFQRKSMEEARELQRARVADAQLKLERDVELLLKDADRAFVESNRDELKATIRKIAILDVTGKYSKELSLFKVKFKALELRQAEITAIKTRFQKGLIDQDITRSEKAIRALQNLNVDVTTLENQLEQLKLHIDQGKALEARFQIEIKTWKLNAAKESFTELEALKLARTEVLPLSNRLRMATVAAQEAEGAVRGVTERDSGKYSSELSLEVNQLLQQYPDYPSLLKLQTKFASYPQTVRVPADVTSLDEALELARSGDTVELGEGVFYAECIIDKAITIIGSGIDKTVLESSMINGPALSFSHKVGKSSLSGLSVKGDRESSISHSLVVVDGAELDMRNCRVRYSPGHGLAVSSGTVSAASCIFSDNSWDGVSVKGRGSKVSLNGCQSYFNVEHGVDFWGGSQGVIVASHVSDNSKSGVVAIGLGTTVKIAGVGSNLNREAGFYIADQAKVICASGIEAKGNICSGFVLKGAGSVLELNGVNSDENSEFGYLIDPAATLIHQSPLKGEGNLLGLKNKE